MSAVVDHKAPEPAAADSAPSQPADAAADPTPTAKPARTKSESESSTGSEGKPVRRQLEKTNITKPDAAAAGSDADTAVADTVTADTPPTIGGEKQNGTAGATSLDQEPASGKPRKKRSYDDLTADDAPGAGQESAGGAEVHSRKRSRDVKSWQPQANGICLSPEPAIPEEADEPRAGKAKTAVKGQQDGEPKADASEPREKDREQGDGDQKMESPPSTAGDKQAEKHDFSKGEVEKHEPTIKNEVKEADDEHEKKTNNSLDDTEATKGTKLAANTDDAGVKGAVDAKEEKVKKENDAAQYEDHLSVEKSASTDKGNPESRRTRSTSRKRNADEVEGANDHSRSGKRQKSPATQGKSDAARDQDADQRQKSPSPPRSPRKRTREDQDETAAKDPKIRKSMEEERPALPIPEDDAKKSAEPAKPEASKTKLAPSSGFANASASSPFGNISGGSSWLKSPPTAAATTSPFKPSNPAPSAAPSSFGDAAKSPSPFGAVGSSATGSAFGSGKGVFGSAFASGFGSSGSKLSTFASSSANAEAKKDAKQPAFGAPADAKEDEGGDEGSGDEESGDEVASEPDTDAGSKTLEGNTGEENEIAVFNGRGKLFNFSKEKKAWVERGVGPIRLNLKRHFDDDDGYDLPDYDSDEGADEAPVNPQKAKKPAPEPKAPQKPEARFLMRAAATHKVILNSPVFKTMNVGGPQGERPAGRQLYFQAHIDGKLTNCLLRMAKEIDILDLYKEAKNIRDRL